MNEFTQSMIRQAARGDQNAIEDLYALTYTNVYHTVKALIQDEDTVLDVVQDSYVKAFQSLDQLDTPENFRAWIKRIAANKAKDYIKKKKPILFSEMAAEDGEEIDFRDEQLDHLPEEVIDRQETTRLMNEILGTLSEDQRLVIGMHYYEEMSVREIAELLGVSENTVKSRLNYGRKKIEVKVRDLERRGTKLYSLAPLPFLLWLFRLDAQAAEIPSAAILEAVTAQCAAGAGAAGAGAAGAAAAGAGAASAAGAGAAAAAHGGAYAAAGATKALVIKLVAGILAVTVTAGSAVAYAVVRSRGNDEAQTSPAYTQEVSPEETASVETGTENTGPANNVNAPDAAFDAVLGQYREAMTFDSKAFIDACYAGNTGAFFGTDEKAMVNYHNANLYGGTAAPCYACYDINGDGVEELLMGVESGGYTEISSVYTFNGSEADRIAVSGLEFESLGIQVNGLIRLFYSDAEAVHPAWRIGPDGSAMSVEPVDADLVTGFNWQKLDAVPPAQGAEPTAAYHAVLESYADVLTMDSQAFLDAWWNDAPPAYFNGDHVALFYYHGGMWEGALCYAYFDINCDGVEELLIGQGGDGWDTVYDLYGFDGQNAVQLIDEPTLGDRSQLTVYENGTLCLTGSSGAADTSYEYFTVRGGSLAEAEPYEGAAVTGFPWQPIPLNARTQAGPEEAFDTVLDQYRDAMAVDHQDYADAGTGAYFGSDEQAMQSYHNAPLRGGRVDVLYAYYDIDQDGVKELLIGSHEEGGGTNDISSIYAFNGSTALRIIRNPVELDSRAHLYVNSDGTVEVNRSDMEDNHFIREVWRLSGSALTECAPTGAEGVWEFDWQVLGGSDNTAGANIDRFVGQFMNGNGDATTLKIEKLDESSVTVRAIGYEDTDGDFTVEEFVIFEGIGWMEGDHLVIDVQGMTATFTERENAYEFDGRSYSDFRLEAEDALIEALGSNPAFHNTFTDPYTPFDPNSFGP